MKTRPLKWHGGKAYLARWIVEHFPRHTHYVEPYFGGGQVLFAKPERKVSEVVNDLNGELTNFWRVLQQEDTFATFSRLVDAIPFSQVEFRDALESESSDPVERAVAFFVRYRQSRQGLGKDFATMSRTRTRGGCNEQANSWMSAVDCLPDAHQRLRGVVIFNIDAVDLIQKQDGSETLYYLDPPYMHETRSTTSDYACEMSESDHLRLLDALSAIQGNFILSGYPSALYDDYADRHDWTIADREIDNKASSAATKERKTERLWMNFSTEKAGLFHDVNV